MDGSEKNALHKHDFAVLMAGGSGTRLWPMSRKNKPKQFQRLVGDATLLQRMYRLLLDSFPPDRIFVQIPAEYLPYVREQLSEVADAQIIIEPEARDTAPAFAYAAAVISSKDEDGNIGIFYADHFIDTPDIFKESIALSFEAVKKFPTHIVLVGVKPLFAHTGLGYIEIDAQVPLEESRGLLYKAKSFIEKPDTKKAETFLASPQYLWNTGYKIAHAKTLLSLFTTSQKEYREVLPQLIKSIADGDSEKAKEYFSKLPEQSFEYLITEKTGDLLTVSSAMLWSDVGDWETMHRMLVKKEKNGLHTSGKVVELDCNNTLLISNHRPIVAIGVENLVVVETKDAILIMSKNRSQDIKPTLKRLIENEPDLS